jgi:excisionase family DNA binding protein
VTSPLPSEVAAALQVIVEHITATTDPWVDAAACELPQRAIRDAVRRGEIEGHRVAKRLLIRRSELDRYIAARRVIPEVREQRENVRTLLGRGRRIA